jgi:hypothetical protein
MNEPMTWRYEFCSPQNLACYARTLVELEAKVRRYRGAKWIAEGYASSQHHVTPGGIEGDLVTRRTSRSWPKDEVEEFVRQVLT